MSSTDPIVIVGAGPAGALLALLLAERGLETTLIERQSDFQREFRGEALMPGGRAMLAQAGVDLAGVAQRQPRRVQLFIGRRRVVDRAFGADEARMPLVVSQPELLEHLVALASRHACFRFLRGASVLSLDEQAGRITGVRVREQGGESHLPARFVVGADGRGSVVRRRLGFDVRERGAPMDVVWFKVPWPEQWKEARGRAHLGNGHLLIALPAADGLLQIAWVIVKGSYGDLRERGLDEWVRDMEQHVDEELAAHLRVHGGSVTHPFVLKAEVDCVRDWTRPGVLLIGDAAHTMSPVGAQGLNIAMRDSVVAANHLVPALRDGGDVDTAARAVQAERQPEIDFIQRLASLPPRVVLGTSVWHRAARWMAGAILSLPFGAGLGARQARPFLNGVRDVELRV